MGVSRGLVFYILVTITICSMLLIKVTHADPVVEDDNEDIFDDALKNVNNARIPEPSMGNLADHDDSEYQLPESQFVVMGH